MAIFPTTSLVGKLLQQGLWDWHTIGNLANQIPLFFQCFNEMLFSTETVDLYILVKVSQGIDLTADWKKVQVILQLELDNQSVDGKFPEQRVFSTLCLWQGPIKESRAWLNLREVGFPTNTYVSTAQVGDNLPLWRAETREAQQLSTRLLFSVSK